MTCRPAVSVISSILPSAATAAVTARRPSPTRLFDLTYVWEISGKGGGGNTPGVFGMAYLESPGNPNDNIDNDDDGLLNENATTTPGQSSAPTDGIQNLQKFLSFYNIPAENSIPIIRGDEDQDW